LLEYADEPGGIAGTVDPQPMNLGVIIAVKSASGKTHDFTVNLLRTALAPADPSSEARK